MLTKCSRFWHASIFRAPVTNEEKWAAGSQGESRCLVGQKPQEQQEHKKQQTTTSQNFLGVYHLFNIKMPLPVYTVSHFTLCNVTRISNVARLFFLSQKIASALPSYYQFYQMRDVKAQRGRIIILQWLNASVIWQVWYLSLSTNNRGKNEQNYFCFNYWKPHLADYWCRMSQYRKHTWLQYLSWCHWAIWKTCNLEVAVWSLISTEP